MMNYGGGLLGNRNGGFWRTPDETLISDMRQPWQDRVNSMWGKYAPAGTALPGTFGAWESAIRGYRGNGRDDTGGGSVPGGTPGGGAGTPNVMTWAFPQYSQTWAFTPPMAPPVTLPPTFNKSAYAKSDKDSKKK